MAFPAWRRTSEYAIFAALWPLAPAASRSRTWRGLPHTVDVTAKTLYEAVALGLAAIRGHDWVTGIPEGLHPVTVQVTNIPVKHEVKLGDFTKWLERKGGSPREVAQRYDIREILGVPQS